MSAKKKINKKSAKKSVTKPVKKSSVKKVAAAKKPVKKAVKKTAPVVKKPVAAVKRTVEFPKRSLEDLPIKHIAVAGNIGSGKTTLTEKLAQQFKWEAQYEDVEGNPYLNDFYEDMPRWSFNLQMYFLNNRFKQIISIQRGTRAVIQDRTIYEDAHIFAPNLHSMGLMSTRDFENYLSMFKTMSSLIKPPDLLVYLKASIPTLVNQIQKRGREYEENLRLDYIRRLNEYYEEWSGRYREGRMLVIDVDTCNFAEDSAQLGEVINKVRAELFGLFK